MVMKLVFINLLWEILKMKNSFKLRLLAAAVLMASGVAHAGSAYLNGVAISSNGTTTA
jgi:hypothetical protein